jgi:type IV pilus assembly protein PilM
VADEARATLAAVAEARLIDLVGAGVAAVAGREPCDLAPPALHAGREAQRRRPRWAIAAALLVLAALLPGVHYHRLAAARLEAARTLRQQTVPVEALREQNQQRLAELDRLQAQVEIISRLVEARQAWAGLLADLQEGLLAVGDVWLEGLQVLPVEVSADDPASAVRMRLRLTGRLLDRENPMSRVSQATHQRATQLLEHLLQSPQVREIEGERFDASEPGVLRFDCTLVVNPTSSL